MTVLLERSFLTFMIITNIKKCRNAAIKSVYSIQLEDGGSYFCSGVLKHSYRRSQQLEADNQTQPKLEALPIKLDKSTPDF